MTDEAIAAVVGGHPKSICQEFREGAVLALAVLAFPLLLVGAVAFFASLLPPPD